MSAATAAASTQESTDQSTAPSRPPNAENLMLESMLDMDEGPEDNDGSDQAQENEDNDEDDELQGDVSNIQQKDEGDDKDEIITDDKENMEESKSHHDTKANIDMDMDADNLEELAATAASNEKNKTAAESLKFTSLMQKPTAAAAVAPAKNVSVAELEAEDIEEEQTV